VTTLFKLYVLWSPNHSTTTVAALNRGSNSQEPHVVLNYKVVKISKDLNTQNESTSYNLLQLNYWGEDMKANSKKFENIELIKQVNPVAAMLIKTNDEGYIILSGWANYLYEKEGTGVSREGIWDPDWLAVLAKIRQEGVDSGLSGRILGELNTAVRELGAADADPSMPLGHTRETRFTLGDIYIRNLVDPTIGTMQTMVYVPQDNLVPVDLSAKLTGVYTAHVNGRFGYSGWTLKAQF
jgi:hypothetical protein